MKDTFNLKTLCCSFCMKTICPFLSAVEIRLNDDVINFNLKRVLSMDHRQKKVACYKGHRGVFDLTLWYNFLDFRIGATFKKLLSFHLINQVRLLEFSGGRSKNSQLTPDLPPFKLIIWTNSYLSTSSSRFNVFMFAIEQSSIYFFVKLSNSVW